MPRWFLAILFSVIFLAVLVAGLPASLVARQANLKGAGFDYMRISGTLWSGEISRLHLAGQPLGEVEFRLKPAALLSGRLAYDVSIDGTAMHARGQAETGFDRNLTLRDMVADVNVQALNRLDPRLRQSPATLAVTVRELSIARDRSCRRADGGVRTDLLQSVGQRWDWAGPEMRGVLSCEQGVFSVAMSGSGADDDIRAQARFDARRAVYDVDAQVSTTNRGVAQALRTLDFVAEDGVFTYSRSNDPQQAVEGELQN